MLPLHPLNSFFTYHHSDPPEPPKYPVASVKTKGKINLLFLNGGVITPLFPETDKVSSFHPLVIGPIRRALPHRNKRKAAFRTGGQIREAEGGHERYRMEDSGERGRPCAQFGFCQLVE